MTTRLILTQKSCVMVALLIFVGLFGGCDNEKSDNGKPFEFLGEAIDRPDNFDKDTIVTPANIDSLYRQFIVEKLFNGDYYLIRSKQSYTTSRYLSRLIYMKNGQQVAAQTFYDSEIDANAVIRLKNRIIVGLNSLRDNYYDSTFHVSTHKCRIIVLSDSLTPIVGRRFYSKKGHTYIESLMQNTDSTFFCSVASGDVELIPKSRFQYRAHYNLYIERQTYVTNDYGYEVKSEELDLSKPDWCNDLSGDFIIALKNSKNIKEATIDGTLINSSYTASEEIISLNSASNSISKSCIPSNYILVAGGHLSYKGNFYEDYKKHNVDIDSFYISAYELTQGEYERVMGELRKFNYQWLIEDSWFVDEGPIYNEVRGDNIPVRGSLRDFAEYCNKRSTQEGFDGFYTITENSVEYKENGNGYRLVTPYEWIYAAYGGGKNIRQKYLGGKSLSEVAWHLGNSKSKPHPVGQKKPNVIGLFDMQGNAPEILQGDKKYKCYVSMLGGYNISNWNYEQAYDITYICRFKNESDLLVRTYGTRIVFIPKGVNNKNLKRTYKY
ncbi:MAG: formylglycine-generating enzyme family protein [Prevotella sp.]